MKYTVEAALEAKKKGVLKNWVIELLNSEKSFELAEKIASEKIVAVEMHEVPLSLIKRIQGPQEKIEHRKPPHVWENELKKMHEKFDDDFSPPPIIVTDFWNYFEIADGNHRHEVLEKRGVKKCWVIFFIKYEAGLKYLHESLKRM